MDYSKTVWQTGDKITAEKLNNLETAVSELAELSSNTIYYADGGININNTFIVDSNGNLTSVTNGSDNNFVKIQDGYLLSAISGGASISLDSGILQSYDYGYTVDSSPEGAICIDPTGAYGYYLDTTPWFRVVNSDKEVNIDGALNVSETVVLSNTTEASGTENNSPALIVGGPVTSAHLEFDASKVMAKGSELETAALYLNSDGGDVYVNNFRVPEIQYGYVNITPEAANTPTGVEITFDREFSGTPLVFTSARTTIPGTTVLGTSAGNVTSTGATIYVTRTNTIATGVNWLAIY